MACGESRPALPYHFLPLRYRSPLRSTWYGEGTVCPMLQVNSVIISAVVVSNNENQTVDTSRLSEPILITLQHEDMALEDPVCTFLNEQEVRFQQG